jgi:CDP-diacylglycerol--glycerol-3-phosphate 3-phosphatidyltransferase
MSIILLIPETFSIAFDSIYIYCGISDMLDGYIARKSINESEIGARLDSIADIMFVIVAMIKILPVLNLSKGIIIWIGMIALIKAINVICSYICYKKLVLPHTIANKITGFILFIAPFMIVNTNPLLFEIIICSVATFAAIQEGDYLRTKN